MTHVSPDLHADLTARLAAMSAALDAAEVIGAPPPEPTVSLLDFGAVGNGATNDAAAIQRAFNEVPAGVTLIIPEGRVFAHGSAVTIHRDGLVVRGGGTLLATNPDSSALVVEGAGTLIEDVTFRMGATTARLSGWHRNKVSVWNTGNVLRRVTIDGAAAAGIYVGEASGFLLDRCVVRNSRADGIHITTFSSNGQVIEPVVSGTGDDGVAVVSYTVDGAPCRNITVTSPRVTGQTWGRGCAVVGGEDITFTDVYVDRSSSAGIYVSAEGSYDTFASKRVLFEGGEVRRANYTASVDHGAIMLFCGRSGRVNEDITIRGVRIIDTDPTAPWQVGMTSANGGAQRRVSLEDIAITGGPANNLRLSGVAASNYRTRRWTRDGSPLPDHNGWS